MEQQYIERYWRDATPQDAIKDPPMVARFRNYVDYDWRIDFLTGIRCNHDYPWYSVRLGSHKHCQVYDAPDPGEGWRLIDPEKESPEEGDEFFEHGYWKTRRAKTDPFAKTFYYRRRIEQPKPEPQYEPFQWEDREQLRGRWVYRIHANGTRDERMLGYAQQAANGDIEFGGFFPDTLVREWKFLDTGEPVGRKIAQTH